MEKKSFFCLNRWKGGGAWYSAYTPLYSNHSYNILVENKELQTFLFFQGASTSYNLGHYPQYYPPHNPSAGWQSGWQSQATTWNTIPNTILRTTRLKVGSHWLPLGPLSPILSPAQSFCRLVARLVTTSYNLGHYPDSRILSSAQSVCKFSHQLQPGTTQLHNLENSIFGEKTERQAFVHKPQFCQQSLWLNVENLTYCPFKTYIFFRRTVSSATDHPE